MQITINTDDMSELDIAVMQFLISGDEEAEPEPTPPAAAAKKAPAKKAVTKAPEPEEDLLGGDGPTLADAVAAATALVANGEAAKVKAALTEVGAKRVNELKDEDVSAFLAALEAE